MEMQSVENKFKFISIAAARCQQLQRGARPRVESRSRKPTTVAQEEVRQGLVVAREPEVVEAPAQTSEVATHTEGTDVE
ncbi:MAG: DNA-directed RNA polymerase subunit omega [Acidobacteria bacterium]|nr:MAG: DNA-directed RNA polymerase subunit omega [Acidobacteriota bacterium]